MDDTPSPREGGRLPLAIESVRWNRTDSGFLVRIAGHWTMEPPFGLQLPALVLGDPDAPLLVEALDATSGASARAAGGERPFRAAFALAREHEALLAAPLSLDLGFGPSALPAAEAPAGEASLKTTVVDSAELAERRARRAEAAQHSTTQRAEDAEAAVERLELELAQMELRMQELRSAGPPAPAPAQPTAPSQLADAVAELRELVARSERAAATIASRDAERARTLRRETELARDAPAAPPLPRLAPSSPEATREAAALRDAERRQAAARTAPKVDRRANEGLRAELANLRRELAGARRQIAARPGDAGLLIVELERQRAAGRKLSAEVAAGARELRAALVKLTGERDEARRRVERLTAELERARRSADAHEKAWDAATELAREAVASASQAVEEAEARADRLERDLAQGAEALERAQALIADLTSSPNGVRHLSGNPPDDAAGTTAASAPWLADALANLLAEDEERALDVLIELFAAQRDLPEPFDLAVDGRDLLRVEPTAEGTTVRPRTDEDSEVRLTVRTDAQRLHGLLTGKRRPPRVKGPLRARRALRRALHPVSLDLAELASAGVLPPPRALYAALVSRMAPAWLASHELVVEQDISGPGGDRWYVVVADGGLELRDDLPEGRAAPDASVRGSQVAFAHVLSGRPAPAGEKMTLRGDRIALALLTQWTERARQ